LLPRLAGHVVPIYVEATSEETEVRLLKGLHRRCPDLSAGLGLAETMASLRRQLSAGSDRTSTGATAGKKVLIVLDQFEQWLHARRELQGTELATGVAPVRRPARPVHHHGPGRLLAGGRPLAA